MIFNSFTRYHPSRIWDKIACKESVSCKKKIRKRKHQEEQGNRKRVVDNINYWKQLNCNLILHHWYYRKNQNWFNMEIEKISSNNNKTKIKILKLSKKTKINVIQ